MSAAEIIAQMQAEALEWGRLRGLARSESMQITSQLPVRGLTNREMEARRALIRQRNEHGSMWLITDRDPCVGCGTRKDWHDEFGCKRWRAG